MTTTTATTEPSRDEFGVTHRRGCDLPGYEAHTTSIRGVLLLRCDGCDAQRLSRGGAR